MPHNEYMSKQVRLSDEAHEALEVLAKENCRSYGQQLEVLIRDETNRISLIPNNLQYVPRDIPEPTMIRRAKAPAVKAKDYGRLQKGKK